MRRALKYTRISRDREGRELGVQRQNEDVDALADRLGIQIVGSYCDNDIGASPRSKKRRPDYERMLADARAGKGTVILAYTTSRLSRRPREREDLVELSEQYGIEFQYVRSPSFDLNTSAGRRVARILAATDAGEAEDTAERLERAKLQAAQSGKYRGGRRPFGYEKDGVTVRGAEAVSLALAADEILSGLSPNTIARRMRSEGFERIDGRAVTRMLVRPRNVGLMEYRGEVMMDPGTGKAVRAEWPPIMHESTWHAVRARLGDPGRRTTPGPTRRYQGSGLYLCGTCGVPVLTRTAGGAGVQRGQVSYKCRAAYHVLRRVDHVDEMVDAAVVERVQRPDILSLLTADSGPDLADLSREAMSLRERIAEAGDMWESGEITRAERKIRVDRLQTRLDEVDAQMQHTTSPALYELIDAEDIASAWSAMSVETCQGVIRSLMTVTIHPSRKGRPPGWQPGDSYFDPSTVVIGPPA